MHSVCAIHGGFSNHVRWLMLLSKEYNGVLNSSGFIIQRETFPSKGIDKKEYILKYIYNNLRTCFNWLMFEHIFNTKIDTVIPNCHSMASHMKSYYKDVNKTILVRCDNIFGVGKWLKFTPWTILELKKKNALPIRANLLFNQADEVNNSYIPKKDDHTILKCYSKTLYNDLLDEEFYNNMVNFFKISNEYESAKAIHSAWYNLQIKAKQDFLNWLYHAEYPEFPWEGHWMQSSLQDTKKKITYEDFEFMRDYLKTFYEGTNA